MLCVDGARGEGGGQLLRTALALSLLSGEPLRLENIRAGRRRPGLMRQHLTCVQLAATVSNASLEGAALGSKALTFRPNAVRAGEYHAAIGSAGSTTLVLQTVLPALLNASGPSTLVLEGGTHNPHSPPFDFLELAFLPLLNRMGARVAVRLERAGYYPAGGGKVRITVHPCVRLLPLELLERGPVRSHGARAVVAALAPEIARRELAVLEHRLGWKKDVLHAFQAPEATGPGNVLMATVASDFVTEVFTGFGAKGRSAESIGEEVASEVEAYLGAGVPVGVHLADQLLIPLAMAGAGAFRTLDLSLHAQTQLELLGQLAGAHFHVKPSSVGVLVSLGGG
jgi:RNA 3'-terminal phosphate cyclase (ATP)